MDSFTQVEERRSEVGKMTASRFSAVVLGAVAVLLPIFFIPSISFSLAIAKMILLSVGVLSAFAAVILSVIQNGEMKIPNNLLTAGLLAIPVAFLVSAVLSPAPSFSLWGYGTEVGTFGFILLSSILAVLVATIFVPRERHDMVMWGTLGVSSVIGLFHLLRFVFGADVLSLSLFTNVLANTVGGWNEVAVWFGLVILISMMALELLVLSGFRKILAYVAFALSAIMLVVINFPTAWYITGIFALVFMVYELTRGTSSGGSPAKRRIAWHAFIVAAIALVAILANTAISTGITDRLGVGSIEVRPSWTATWEILRVTLAENPLIGSGANNFEAAWNTNKPVGINNTIFWNTDFNSGIGLLPTFAVTTGLIGIAAWVFLLFMLVRGSIQLIFRETEDGNERFLAVSAAFGALFLWTAAIVYVPSIALFASAFFFTGLVMASLYRSGSLRRTTVSLFAVPRASFISVIVLIVLLIGAISLGYLFVERAIAQIYFNKAIAAASGSEDVNQNIATVEENLAKAIAIHPFDTFYRASSETSMTKLSLLLQNQSATAEEVRTGFQNLLSQSIQSAQSATVVRPLNYQNWVALARVYASVVPAPFNIEDAYESAQAAFVEAKRLNPSSPSILLAEARLETDKGDLAAATMRAEEAATLKTNYADAHFLLSQLAVQQGNISRAIEKTETTILLSPQNAGLYFQLGVLYFNIPNYENAAAALSQAVAILPDYANARYFLGLSLARLGDRTGATAQFEEIQKANPDNEEVASIISNLKAGRDPLAGIAGGSPARRDELPVSEQ